MSDTTNDPQGKYGDPSAHISAEVGRSISMDKVATAPMLPTDSELTQKNYEMRGKPGHYLDGFSCGAKWMRGIVEAKIASGELMVVKTARMTPEPGAIGGPGKECSSCGVSWLLASAPKVGEFCRCGAKIIEG